MKPINEYPVDFRIKEQKNALYIFFISSDKSIFFKSCTRVINICKNYIIKVCTMHDSIEQDLNELEYQIDI